MKDWVVKIKTMKGATKAFGLLLDDDDVVRSVMVMEPGEDERKYEKDRGDGIIMRGEIYER